MDPNVSTTLGRKRWFLFYIKFKRTYYKHTKNQVQSFFKESKPATETSSTQCPLVALQRLMWRGYTANYKRQRGISASCHKRRNSLFRWATDLELNWQSILVKSGQYFQIEYSVKHTLDRISTNAILALIERKPGNTVLKEKAGNSVFML